MKGAWTVHCSSDQPNAPLVIADALAPAQYSKPNMLLGSGT